MKKPKETVRRFSPFEVACHWCQAIPYLVLFGTGVLMLVERLLGVEPIALEGLSRIHCGAGVVLIALLAQALAVGLFNGGVRRLLESLRTCARLSLDDGIWLAKVPLTLLRPALHLPPVGRFNAGQKLHVLMLVAVVPGFILSGLVMIWLPGSLGAWILHVALLAPAGAFLSVHLFLSLINPPTRQALTGMVTGRVPADYARGHHPLWAPGTPLAEGAPHKIVSPVALAIALLLAGALAAYGIRSFGPGRMRKRLSEVLAQRGRAAILPGKLAESHARDPGTERCGACHRLFGQIRSSDCLDCHEDLAGILQRGQGYHGTLRGECRTCHREHRGPAADIRPLDRASFNHDLARFTLEGKHRNRPCEDCHGGSNGKDASAPSGMRYTNLTFGNCVDCHPDPHGESAERAACASCHTPRGWRGRNVRFEHNRDSEFALKGKHASTDCARCHPPADAQDEAGFPLSGLPRTCVGCHEDPHGGQFGEACERCHSEQGWRGDSVAPAHGPKKSFPLLGKHGDLECVQCHRPARPDAPLAQARFAGLGTSCEECHEDPHRGQMSAPCTTCHTETGWGGRDLLFSHAWDTKFQLSGAHGGVACGTCHVPTEGGKLASAKFAGLGTDCADCHQDPHGGQFRSTCTRCHSENGWSGRWLAPVHGRKDRFRLQGRHADLACTACHVPPTEGGTLAGARFRDLGTRCSQCHEDPHAGEMRHPCSTCHSEQGWKGPSLFFSHVTHAEFDPDRDHAGFSCTRCHPAGQSPRFRPLPTDCEGCHTETVAYLAGRSPAGDGEPDAHAGRVSCRDCHRATGRPQTPDEYANACGDCHNDRYRGLFHDWRKALSLREARARALSSAARTTAPPNGSRDRIEALSAIGFHNLQLARKLWDAMLTERQTPVVPENTPPGARGRRRSPASTH